MAADLPDVDPTTEACRAMSTRLARMFPRVIRGFRRHQEQAAPATSGALGPRHVAALQQLLDGPVGVGDLATRLALTLPTVSGVVADLDRAGFVERRSDHRDRRRTIVEITPARRQAVDDWLEGTVAPLARVLDCLEPAERVAFLKAMDLLEKELSSDEGSAAADSPPAAADSPPAA